MTVGGGAIDSRKLTEAVRQACLDAAVSAYEDASLSGLCHEGAWEVAVGAIRSVDVASLALGDRCAAASVESSAPPPARSALPAGRGARVGIRPSLTLGGSLLGMDLIHAAPPHSEIRPRPASARVSARRSRGVGAPKA